ncbi:MAG: LysR family transcriptional regulator [Desulfuromonas sp.]|nr:LysR family transcriptional regulator [Desulfuromonas sp.]
METQYLKTLLIAAEEGSFSRAAAKLHLTQSAVSQRTKSLETCCGMQLLDRSGATLQPTVAGRIVLERARCILEMEERMLQDLRSLTDRQHLSICCTPAFGMAHLPHVLKHFMQQFGEVEDLKFLFDVPRRALDGVRNGEFDVAVIEHLADMDFGAMRYMELPQEEMLFVSAPGKGPAAGEVELVDLEPHLLITRCDGCSCRDLLAHNLESVKCEMDMFRRVMVLDDFGLIIKEVLAGEGVTFIARSAVAQYLSDGLLLEHHVPGFNRFCRRSMVACECESSGLLKRAFMESVQSHFGCFADSDNLG